MEEYKEINIQKISDISIEQLELLKREGIEKVIMNNAEGPIDTYRMEDFIKIKNIVNDMSKKIDMPEIYDRDREKKIYAQVEKMMSDKIKYDTFVEKNKVYIGRIKDDGNLNVLLNNRAICAGYVDVMQKVMQNLNIHCEHIRAVNIKGEKNAHSWIKAYLDGEVYEDDITWNISHMQKKENPKDFLRGLDKNGNREFFKDGHRDYDIYNGDVEDLTKGISQSKQTELIGRFTIKDKFTYLFNKFMARTRKQNLLSDGSEHEAEVKSNSLIPIDTKEEDEKEKFLNSIRVEIENEKVKDKDKQDNVIEKDQNEFMKKYISNFQQLNEER